MTGNPLAKLLAAGAVVALLVSQPGMPALASTHDPSTATGAPMAAALTPLRQLVGQKLMVAMSGTVPSDDLLGRITRGEVGGVILFGANIRSAGQLRRLTRALQSAAAAGGRPPLLIATDQEGGAVKRVSWAPPTLSPPQMGAIGNAVTAASQGKGTGRVLGCAGVNHDLAPVADVPSSTASFMYQEGRTWSFDASVTASLTNAFASGLSARGVMPTMKHFPGIGFASRTTDANVVTIRATRSALAPGLRPYRQAIAADIPVIMLSNATYTAYDPTHAAGWSRAIAVDLLRGSLGFTGISMTDSLSGIAAARGVAPSVLAIRAAQAGTDMILVTGSEAATASVYGSLLAAARDGRIGRARLQSSYDRILATKQRIVPPPADSTPPTVEAPTSILVAGGTLGVSGTPVVTSWSATDPCHVAAYALRRQQDGGARLGQPLPGSLTRSVTQPLHFGSTYHYGARATDGAGNASGWTGGIDFRPRISQESAPEVTYRGRWSQAASDRASGSSLAFSRVAGASARMAFTGSSVSWVASRGPKLGAADVYVDGRFVRTVDLHAAAPRSRAIVFARHWTADGPHTIRIVNRATSGHPRIDLDAFVRLVSI